MVLEQSDIHKQKKKKKETWPKPRTSYNCYFKIDHTDLNVKCKTLKLLGENIKKKPLWPVAKQKVLGQYPQNMIH